LWSGTGGVSVLSVTGSGDDIDDDDFEKELGI
jgi:hypothetical protein